MLQITKLGVVDRAAPSERAAVAQPRYLAVPWVQLQGQRILPAALRGAEWAKFPTAQTMLWRGMPMPASRRMDHAEAARLEQLVAFCVPMGSRQVQLHRLRELRSR